MPLRIVFPAPREVAAEAFELSEAREGQVFVRNRYTLMSTGTENIVLNRDFDDGTHFDRWARFPFRPGYLAVGTSDQVVVFHRGNHASHAVVDAARCVAIPHGVDLRDATWCGLAKIAFRGAYAARYRVGDDVVIVGAGPVGQMSIRWAAAAGLARIVVVDPAESRLEHALRGGATEVHPVDVAAARDVLAGRPHRLIVDTTGNAAVFESCLALAERFGKIVLLGDTGHPRDQRLGPEMIVKGLTVVGAHDVHDRDGWDEPRISHLFFDLVAAGRFPLDGLITHEMDPRRPADAYALVNERRHQTMGVCFAWDGVG